MPVFVGVILSLSFSLSVLRDEPETAAIAWRTGGELLGLYGGFALVALPFLFVATAHLRRGRRRGVDQARIHRDELLVTLVGGRVLHIPLARIRSGFTHPSSDGRVLVSLELEGGLTDGDRVVLELEEAAARPIADALVGEAPQFDLTRKGYEVGVLLGCASLLAGGAIAQTLFIEVSKVAAGLRMDAAMNAAEVEGWRFGLFIAASGLVSAFLNLIFSSKSVKVGVDGLRIESVFSRTFIPYEDIEEVSAADGALIICGPRGRRSLFAPGVDARVLEEIAALATRRANTSASLSEKLVTWQPQTVKRWREAILRKVDSTSYRDRSVSDEDLAAALAAPGLTRERRAAVAVALASRGDDAGRCRLRVAAAAVADDTTRVLLERLAEEEADDAAIEAALARHLDQRA